MTDLKKATEVITIIFSYFSFPSFYKLFQTYQFLTTNVWKIRKEGRELQKNNI